jgi:DNA adenine methylase
MERFIEPFAGSAALSIACAAENRASCYWLNDYNAPLASLLQKIIDQPENIADSYQALWHDHPEEALERYYRVREDFNRANDPCLLLYLLARCVKGSVRYNANGMFNQSPDKRRLGTRPQTMRRNLERVSALLRNRDFVTARDYREVLADSRPADVIYMDPPYQGVCGERDSRYFSGIDFEDFICALAQLNERGIHFLVSYDGCLGSQSYGKALPACLDLTRVEIDAGRSSQATLLGRNDVTIESLYLSRSLVNETSIKTSMYCHAQQRIFQPSLFTLT